MTIGTTDVARFNVDDQQEFGGFFNRNIHRLSALENLVDHRGDTTIEFAAQHRLPTLYSTAGAVRQGGRMSYGPDFAAIELVE